VKLAEKQVEFTETMARFLVWCFDNKYQVIAAEWFRPPELAEIYVKQGKGIKNSVHTKKLALDIFLYKNSTVTWNTEDYRPLGEKWKTLHPLARWGGDFKGRDAVHFSFEHNGVR
jgi:hypothetical protein